MQTMVSRDTFYIFYSHAKICSIQTVFTHTNVYDDNSENSSDYWLSEHAALAVDHKIIISTRLKLWIRWGWNYNLNTKQRKG